MSEADDEMALEILRYLNQGAWWTPRERMLDAWVAGHRLDRDQVDRLANGLIVDGLVRSSRDVDGVIRNVHIEDHTLVITQKGVSWLRAFERARRGLPQASAEVSEVVSLGELRRLEGLTGAVRRLLDDHGAEMDPEVVEDLRAQLDTIAAQQRSPRPRRDVMVGAVGAIRWVADKAAGSAVGRAAWEGVKAAARAVF